MQVRIATSKAIFNIYYNELGTRVASRVAQRHKTSDLRKLGNVRKYQVLVETCALSSFQKINFVKSSQKRLKIRYQIFVVLSNFTVFLYFVSNIFSEIIFSLRSALK